MRQNRCDHRRVRHGKMIGGRGRSLSWYGSVGHGRYYKNNYHRAKRRVAKNYCRYLNNLCTYDAMEFESSDACEDYKPIEHWKSDIIRRGD